MKLLTIAFLLTFAASSAALAQDPLELEPEESLVSGGDWGLAITPYAWFAANATDVGGQALRQSFNDLASITDVGFQSRLLARYRRLVFSADWTWAVQNSETGLGPVSVAFDLEQHILDLKLGGKVFDNRTPARDGGLAVWASGGARYWHNAVDLVVTREPLLPGQDPEITEVANGQDYWDPVLGISMHWPVTPTVGFSADATGGGFGVGSASKYVWDGQAAAHFHVARRFLISTGYRIFKYNREDDGIEQTVTVSGPFAGISIGIF